MDTATPLTVSDGGVDGKPIADGQLADQTVVTQKRQPKKVEKKIGKAASIEPWKVDDFCRDAAWFAENCGLPNEGDTPHKMPYVSEEMLAACFGEKERNGYKLSSCKAIPIEDVLALSQVVDGYDKPVNGVLSLTFSRGVYADMVLRRKVNWAAYAASKLKGQLNQWDREGKGKPDGPPCVRKPRTYVSPVATEEIGSDAALPLSDAAVTTAGVDMSLVLVVDGDQKDSTLPLKERMPDCMPILPHIEALPGERSGPREPAVTPHMLLTLLKVEITKMKTRDEEICSHLTRLGTSFTKVLSIQRENRSSEDVLNGQIRRLESAVVSIDEEVLAEEGLIQDLVTDIELAQNPQTDAGEIAEVNTELVQLLEEAQKGRENGIEQLKCQLKATKKDLQSTRDAMAEKRKSLADLPKTIQLLSSVSETLEKAKAKIAANRRAQELEYSVLANVLSKPCPPLEPRFSITSTGISPTKFFVSSCPVCCFGYHEFNWVPSSCGHAYHPACLFRLIANSKEAPKCMACGEVFNCGWLHTWGLQWTWEGRPVKTPDLSDAVSNMRDVYGKNASRLQQRREIAINTSYELQSKGDAQVEAEQCVASMLPSSVIDVSEEDDCEHLSSKNPVFLIPKVEGGASGTKRKADQSGDQSASRVEKDRKVKPVSNAKPSLAFTPSATLPFSPEGDVMFKPYMIITSPCKDSSSTPLPALRNPYASVRESHVVKFKQILINKSMSTDVDTGFVTLQNVKVDDMWGLCAGSYVYKGCSKILSDGRPCALGKHKRRFRRGNPESPMGPHSRVRSSHDCSVDGAGAYMFCFAIQIGDVTIQVNEENGLKLMRMSAEKFKAEYDDDFDKLQEVCADVKSFYWAITYATDGRDKCRAINIRRKAVVASDTAGRALKQDQAKSEAGPSTTKVEAKNRGDSSKGLRIRTQIELHDGGGDYSGELVASLKSVRLEVED